ncbi:MAG: pyridoxine 5'-phosphate synthase [Chitinophagales bacterium]|nr:pyridoxine 5'-phosphate synthase [Chitinophagales bacterium]
MAVLSVNINKIALIRNSRGRDYPNLVRVALDCERFGAQGITVHPRPDARHVKYEDCEQLKEVIATELNIEGYPSKNFIDLVKRVKPTQVTLVPDAPDALTSDNGWDTITHEVFLKEVIAELRTVDARVSLFINPDEKLIAGAKEVGADRIEFYTGPYAENYSKDREKAIAAYKITARFAHEIGLGVNAGHDLNLDNLAYLKQALVYLDEVSIGHALITDALYYGLENTIQMYKRCLEG